MGMLRRPMLIRMLLWAARAKPARMGETEHSPGCVTELEPDNMGVRGDGLHVNPLEVVPRKTPMGVPPKLWRR